MKNPTENLSYLEKLRLLQSLKEELGLSSRFETDEFMELSIQWAKGEITSTIVCDIVGNKNYTQAVAIGLRRAIRQGRLIENYDKTGGSE